MCSQEPTQGFLLWGTLEDAIGNIYLIVVGVHYLCDLCSMINIVFKQSHLCTCISNQLYFIADTLLQGS